ncbi:MAG TPA: glycosyltransferase, partial [Epsilonproteobacteria bacterium]|nr:glycosyltransferase [Campylobacterota bacterium]
NSCDCVVLPSYREGLSRVLLEAASMAKPIVTTDVPGCREVVEAGVTGFLCKKQDPIDLADKMEKILHLTPEERIGMGAKGREKMIREFDEKLVIAIYLREISQLWQVD